MNPVYGKAARWLLVWLSLCARAARGYDATWPGCVSRQGNVTLTVVKPGIPDNRVTVIRFSNCNISTISIESLKIYPNVMIIDLNDITLTDADPTLAFFTNLELLIMSQTSLARLPSDFFGNNSRLRYIEINHNKIPELNDPNTFSNAVSLTSLSLVNDSISNIHPDIFRPLSNIILIRLHINRLRSIPEPLFQNRSALYFVDLSHNLIDNIPLNAFLGCNNLKSLFLNNNRLMYLPGNFFPNLLATGVNLRQFNFFASSWECRCLNIILIKIKELGIAYDRDRYNGRDPACVMVASIFNGPC